MRWGPRSLSNSPSRAGVEVSGRWVERVCALDATPAGEPLPDASPAWLAGSYKRLMPTDWICQRPGRGAAGEGLAC